jgi:hypothetical protein
VAPAAALSGGPADRYAATARAAARSILAAPPFKKVHRPPGELQRLVDDVAHAVASAVRWVAHQLRHLIGHPIAHGAHVAFGPWADVALALLAGGLVAVGCLLWLRRSRPGRAASAAHATAAPSRRATSLLDTATTAWHDGDLDRALRLRFEAGLEQLEARGALEDRRALTTAALRDQLASRAFDDLAATHTLVAYAGVHASPDDVADAFGRWPEVSETGAHRR